MIPYTCACVRLTRAIPPCRPPGTPAISLVGDFGWDTASPPTLVDVDLEVQAGQLVVVVGPTGTCEGWVERHTWVSVTTHG